MHLTASLTAGARIVLHCRVYFLPFSLFHSHIFMSDFSKRLLKALHSESGNVDRQQHTHAHNVHIDGDLSTEGHDSLFFNGDIPLTGTRPSKSTLLTRYILLLVLHVTEM